MIWLFRRVVNNQNAQKIVTEYDYNEYDSSTFNVLQPTESHIIDSLTWVRAVAVNLDNIEESDTGLTNVLGIRFPPVYSRKNYKHFYILHASNDFGIQDFVKAMFDNIYSKVSIYLRFCLVWFTLLHRHC
jgi:hypothetical protein